MAIEVTPAQLYALASSLAAAAERARQVAGAVPGAPVGGPLGAATVGFGESVRTAGHCLAGELSWLGEAVAAAADSWQRLDGTLTVPGVPG
ncbi:hypothetical protein [Modestobacter italicus]|uniref:hypothetical protein n=1 Tax=Modestobacter italicus (strain DSM 44449 / CECT 9708 / BC 501) TaxID=2732864 RepID=UPI001C956F60|nr:hypothetical protein [Modestobacter italicus]